MVDKKKHRKNALRRSSNQCHDLIFRHLPSNTATEAMLECLHTLHINDVPHKASSAWFGLRARELEGCGCFLGTLEVFYRLVETSFTMFSTMDLSSPKRKPTIFIKCWQRLPGGTCSFIYVDWNLSPGKLGSDDCPFPSSDEPQTDTSKSCFEKMFVECHTPGMCCQYLKNGGSFWMMINYPYSLKLYSPWKSFRPQFFINRLVETSFTHFLRK